MVQELFPLHGYTMLSFFLGLFLSSEPVLAEEIPSTPQHQEFNEEQREWLAKSAPPSNPTSESAQPSEKEEEAEEDGSILNPANWATLLMLIFLQAVLGFDNLLYISIESKRVPKEKQQYVRRIGIGVAIALRIILLFVVIKAIDMLQNPLFSIKLGGLFESTPHTLPDGSTEGGMTVHALIVLAGGIFIIYTAFKEITHMLSIEDIDGHGAKEQTSVGKAIFSIIIMNLVFSFDSILSAIALTHVFWVMAVAIVLSGLMMMLLADQVSEFLKKNRMYEVLGLFILFIVGIMLVSEGGHLAHIKLLDYSIEPMAKSTFYFVIIILVFVDIAQSRYQKKIDAERKQGSESEEIDATTNDEAVQAE